jgi:hypothetical protein
MRQTQGLYLAWALLLVLTLGASRAGAVEVISGRVKVAATAHASSSHAREAEVWVYPSRREQQGPSHCYTGEAIQPLLLKGNCSEGEEESSRRVMAGDLRAPKPVARTRTDAQGYFRVEVPEDKRYQVVARLPGLSGDAEGQASGTWKTLELLPAGRVSGLVTEPEGKPVPRARVWCVDVAPLSVQETSTDAQGRYSCARLSLMGKVLVHAKDYLPQWDSGPASLFDVTPQKEVDIQLTAPRMAWGTVMDDRGRPVRGAQVRLGYTGITALTDARGRFRIPVWTWRYSWLLVSTEQLVTVVPLEPDKPVEDLRIPLLRALSLTLQLQAETDKAVTCERVALTTGWLLPNYRWEARKRSGRTYTLGPVPPGKYEVLVQCDGWIPMVREDVELRESSTWRVPLRPGLAQQLQLVDVSGKPVPDMKVELSSRGPYDLGEGWRAISYSHNLMTNARGRVGVDNALPGAHGLQVEGDTFGEPPLRQNIHLMPGPPLTVQLPFARREERKEERPSEPLPPPAPAGAPPAPGAAPGLERCTVQDEGPGVSFQCREIVFDVLDMKSPASKVFEQAVPRLLEGVNWDKLGYFPVHEGERTVPGRTVRKVTVRSAEADTAPAESYWFGFELDAAWTRVVFCRPLIDIVPSGILWSACDEALRTMPDHPKLQQQLAARRKAGPFEGCRVLAHGPMLSQRRIFCHGLQATATPNVLVVKGEEALLEGAFRDFQRGFHGTVTRVERGPLRLAGQERVALRYEAIAGAVDDARAPRQQGTFTVLPVQGQPRLLSCSWDSSSPGSASHCQEVLEALAQADGLPRVNEKSTPQAREPRALAGRKLGVASWCLLPQENKVDCLSSHLVWMSPAEAAEEPFEQFMDAARRWSREEEGTTQEGERPCVVEGVETTCRFFEASLPGDRAFSLVSGQAVVRGEPLAFRCFTTTRLEEELPVPCRQVLSLKALPPQPEALPGVAKNPVLESGPPVGAPAPVPLQEELGGRVRLVAHGPALFLVVRPGSDGASSELVKVSAGGSREVLARERVGMEDLVVLREHVYWRERDGAIARVPLSGGEVRTAVRFKHMDVLAMAGGDSTLLLQVRRRSEASPGTLPEWALVEVLVPSLEPRLLTAEPSLAQATPLGQFGSQAWFRPVLSDRLQVLELATNQWHPGPEWTEALAPRLVVEHAALYGTGSGRLIPRLDLNSGQLTLLDVGEGDNVLAGAAGPGTLWVRERGSGTLFQLDVATRQRVALDTFPGDLLTPPVPRGRSPAGGRGPPP